MKTVWLRMKDVDFARREIVVRESKGFKERATMPPEAVIAPLRAHLTSGGLEALYDKTAHRLGRSA